MEGSALEMKYFGTCRLSPAHKHRRIDILTIPFNQWGGALIYFTGRSIDSRPPPPLRSLKQQLT
jgi:DNA polymerase lambda